MAKEKIDAHNMFIAFVNKWHKIVKRDDAREASIYREAFTKDARELGHLINKQGGFAGMIILHAQLPEEMKALVTLHWDNIGEWRR